MGLYLTPPISGRFKDNLDWLKQNGTQCTVVDAQLAYQKKEIPIFYWRNTIGEMLAVGYDNAEIRRLINSGQVEQIFLLPKQTYDLARGRG